MKTFQILTTIIIFFLSSTSYAQTGQYDVRFLLSSVDCINNRISVDLEIRATSAETTFNLGDQNYRFSFNRAAISTSNRPIIQEELCVSEFVELNGFAFYDSHTLFGSIDTIVVLNVELQGGDGYPVDNLDNPIPGTCDASNVTNNGWVHVSRLSMQLLGSDVCLNLEWHTQAPGDFPPTNIIERFNNQFYVVEEGNYTNLSFCIADECDLLPVELINFSGYEQDCNIHLDWQTASEINNDYFKIMRSTDGSNFSEIARINGKGTFSEPSSYSFMLNDIDANNYFKLVQVDYDETVTEHETIFVASSCYNNHGINQIYELSPNPVSENEIITMKFTTNKPSTNVLMIIYDILGRQVDQRRIKLVKGINSLQYKPAELSLGTYFVRLKGDNWSSNAQKFIKTTY